MFFGNATMNPMNYGFSIGNDPMYPWQKLARSFGIPKYDFVMLQFFPLSCLFIRSPSIAPNRFQKLMSFFGCRSTSKSLQKPFNTFGRNIVHYLHMRKARPLLSLPVSIKRHSAQNRSLPLASSSSRFTSGPEKRIIHFYQTHQTILSISISHRFPDLVGHEPRGLIIPDIQNTLHLRNRYTNFV